MFRKGSLKKAQPASSQQQQQSSPATPSTPSGSGLAAVPRLAFPAARSRPSSMVDTAGFEIAAEAALSSSPSSSIHSFGAGTSPSQKHSLSAIERLASAQKRDAAASSSHVRVRTLSNTSRSSMKQDGSDGSRSRTTSIPSLMKAATNLSPSKPSTVTNTLSGDGQAGGSNMQKSSSTAYTTDGRAGPSESASSLLAQFSSVDGVSQKAPSIAPAPKEEETKETVPSTSDDAAPLVQPRKDSASVVVQSLPSQAPQKVPGPSTSPVLKKPAAPPLVALLADPQASRLIKQGAEAKVYISALLTNSVLTQPPPSSASSSTPVQKLPARLPILLKWRFPKTYRHPVLSNNITASRTIMEARALLRCAKAGVAVPGVRCLDEKEGILGLELIAGKSVREWLGGGAEGEDEQELDDDASHEAEDAEVLSHEDQVKLMQLIGRQLATMHEADIVHGDLTTSNMMLRTRSDAGRGQTTIDLERDQVVLIDFGLSSVSAFPEDKAVDLYVLERAFASTHPASEDLFKTVLDSYGDEIVKRSSSRKGGKGKPNRWDEVRKRLEEVRLRGRKRSMVGFRDLVEAYRSSRITVGLEFSLMFEARGFSQLLKAVRVGGRNIGGRRWRRRQVKTTADAGGAWGKVRSQLDVELHGIGNSQLIDEPPASSQSSTMRQRHTVTCSDQDKIPMRGMGEEDEAQDNGSFALAIARRQVELCISQRLQPLLPESLTPVARARNGGTSLLVLGRTMTLRNMPTLVGRGVEEVAGRAAALTLWIDAKVASWTAVEKVKTA